MITFDELFRYKSFEGHEMLALWVWLNRSRGRLCAMASRGPGQLTYAHNMEEDFESGSRQSATFMVMENYPA